MGQSAHGSARQGGQRHAERRRQRRGGRRVHGAGTKSLVIGAIGVRLVRRSQGTLRSAISLIELRISLIELRIPLLELRISLLELRIPRGRRVA
jgi:hypothetical protein